ncbi:hypothetical protein ACQR1Y_12140 [Bradyrhizobium sp. HKCCYLRH3099]|uniref:hypothetical protein n=1 Tax=unclassified Bradyrhizobium TaxID=2631580 RepID=UPI003EBB714C
MTDETTSNAATDAASADATTAGATEAAPEVPAEVVPEPAASSVPPAVGDVLDGAVIYEVRRVAGVISVAFAPGGAFITL